MSVESLWLKSPDSVRSVAFALVSRVRIDRESAGRRGILKRGLVFGALSGLGMMSACNRYDSNPDCMSFLVFSLGTSGVLGLLAAEVSHYRRFLVMKRPTLAALAPWARYPQGMPPVPPVSPH